MKAVLVLPEMPDKCTKCPACSGHGVAAFCRAKAKLMNACISGKPDWCPLRPMPEKEKNEEVCYSTFENGYRAGWNNALEEIEGSGEDA